MNRIHIRVGILLLGGLGIAEPTIANGSQIEDHNKKASVVFKIADSIGQQRASGFTIYDGTRRQIGTPEFD